MHQGEWKLIDLYPGAHIRVKSHAYYHHGIYIGNDEVVQFGYPGNVYQEPKDVRVMRSSIEDFVGEAQFIEVYVFSKAELKKKKDDQEIIKEALSHVGEAGYSILRNNCEHFANRCIYGSGTSDQIDDIADQVDKLLAKKKD